MEPSSRTSSARYNASFENVSRLTAWFYSYGKRVEAGNVYLVYPRRERNLQRLGIYNLGDLANANLPEMKSKFGVCFGE